jgi:uncharacterized protein (UPF0371 family)
MHKKEVFSDERYIKAQTEDVLHRISESGSGSFIVDVGGKPFGDKHAERVLPGYKPDTKLKLLKELSKHSRGIIAVDARDVLSPPYGKVPGGRIRGDSGLTYDLEIVRMVNEARAKGISIDDAVLTNFPSKPSAEDNKKLEQISHLLKRIKVNLIVQNKLAGIDHNSFDASTFVSLDHQPAFSETDSLFFISPGSGPTKLQASAVEVFHRLKNGHQSQYLKLATFPVHELNPDHAVNLAFRAAIADQPYGLIQTPDNMTFTGQDFQMRKIMQEIHSYFGLFKEISILSLITNEIMAGVQNQEGIIVPAGLEILRRIERYSKEVEAGSEKESTLENAQQLYKTFVSIYGDIR